MPRHLEEADDADADDVDAAVCDTGTFARFAPIVQAVSIAMLVADLALLVLIFALRQQRPTRMAGVGFLAIIVVGCAAGHVMTLLDSQPASKTLSCILQQQLLYAFVYLTSAPLVGKLASLCKLARMLQSSKSSAWDGLAKRVAIGLLLTQLLLPGLVETVVEGQTTHDDPFTQRDAGEPEPELELAEQQPMRYMCFETRAERVLLVAHLLLLGALCAGSLGALGWLHSSQFMLASSIGGVDGAAAAAASVVSASPSASPPYSQQLPLALGTIAVGALALLGMLGAAALDDAWGRDAAILPLRLLGVTGVAAVLIATQVAPPLLHALRAARAASTRGRRRAQHADVDRVVRRRMLSRDEGRRGAAAGASGPLASSAVRPQKGGSSGSSGAGQPTGHRPQPLQRSELTDGASLLPGPTGGLRPVGNLHLCTALLRAVSLAGAISAARARAARGGARRKAARRAAARLEHATPPTRMRAGWQTANRESRGGSNYAAAHPSLGRICVRATHSRAPLHPPLCNPPPPPDRPTDARAEPHGRLWQRCVSLCSASS